MKLFNENYLADLMSRCYSNVSFRGAILFCSRRKAHEFIKEMENRFVNEGVPGVKEIERNNVTSKFPGIIKFENGSTIDVLTPRMLGRRGLRFHESLLDDEIIDYDTIHRLEMDTIWDTRVPKTHFSTDACAQDDETNKELDDFLNSFKIC